MNDTNKAIITGKIIHIYEISRNPARVIVTVSANGDNPKVFAAGMQAEYIIQNLRIGDTVTVNANLQSSVKSKIGRTVTVFCDSIRKHYSRTENVNRFYLVGDVVSTCTDKKRNVSTMIIRTRVNGRSSTIPVVFYDADHRLFVIVADNPTIAISGKIQTVCKDYGNGIVKTEKTSTAVNDFNHMIKMLVVECYVRVVAMIKNYRYLYRQFNPGGVRLATI